MTDLLLVPLEDTVVFPGMNVTLTVDVGEVNGALAVVLRADGVVSQVVTFDLDGDDRLRSVQIVASPAKLQALS